LSVTGKEGVGKGRWKFAMVFLGAGNALVGSWHWSLGIVKNEHFLITLMNKLTFKGLTKLHKYFTTTEAFHHVHWRFGQGPMARLKSLTK
jgi:hypothetical protein